MKNIMKYAATACVAAIAMTACTDEIKFGDAFIEKAPGGTTSIDTVFSNPTYTEQFLTAIYARQYYGLPYNSSVCNSASPYTGKFDGLTDLYQLHWGDAALSKTYYSGTLTANETPLMGFNNDMVWESVRLCYLLLENIDNVPGLSDEKKKGMIAQTKCLLAERYYDLFPHYGGLPIITQSYTGNEGSYTLERATVEKTVNFMVGLLDEAIPDLQWSWTGNTSDTNSTNIGRWTSAGAMALKAKILTIAASPIFNDDKPYYNGSTEAETNHLVWYGDYQQSRWERAKQACTDFFNAVNQNGYYGLIQASSKTPDGYRAAYRMGYILDESPEALHTTRVISIYGSQATYSWLSWGWPHGSVRRNNYTPTQEYMEMFCWSNGAKFDWEKEQARINNPEKGLFYSYQSIRGGFKKTACRDPRLYENMFVNGQQEQLGWGIDGTSTGNVLEFWVGGYHAGFNVIGNDGVTVTEALTTFCPTGYGCVKYLLDEGFHRKGDNHWNVVTYPEMLLMYAECLAQTGNLPEAVNQVNLVRKRVGMGSITQVDPAAATDKDAMIEQILRERACELGMSNARYYDMVRYKRTDWMVKQLHGLAIFRMEQLPDGSWSRALKPWLGDDKNSGTKEPNRFEYEVFELKMPIPRYFWGKDPESLDIRKWLLSPFPQTEINKGYGLIQNPGW